MNFEFPTNNDNKELIHSSGRSSRAQLKILEKIGEGNFGEVSKVEAIIKDREKPMIFAVKEFHNSGENAQRALKIHTELKKAGISTWPTYRKIKGENSILMTYGTPEEYFLVSLNNNSKSRNEKIKHPYTQINNLYEVVNKAIEDAMNAAENRILLNHTDIWFILFKDIKDVTDNQSPDKQQGEIKKIFIGDFDNVQIRDIRAKLNIALMNITSLKIFVYGMLRLFLTHEANQKYQDVINLLKQKEADLLRQIRNT